jgi:hypothetical protein
MPRIHLTLPETRASAMPPVCVVCGNPVATHVSKEFVRRPLLVRFCFIFAVSIGLVLLLTGGIRGAFLIRLITFPPAIAAAAIAVIVGWAKTRRITVELPVCDRHRHYWTWRGFWVYSPLLALAVATIALGILMITDVIPGYVFGFLVGGCGLILLLWAVAATILARTGVRPVEFTGDDITLDSVHATFIDMIRLDRYESKGRSEFGWDDYDPYPRSPAR